jgi:hypothetical protein
MSIPKWSFLKRKTFELRAPSKINLKDYDNVGGLRAPTCIEAAVVWATARHSTDPEISTLPKLEIGDVLENKSKKEYFIFTPIGLWSKVNIIK